MLHVQLYVVKIALSEIVMMNCDRMKNCSKNWAYCIAEKMYEIRLGYIECEQGEATFQK